MPVEYFAALVCTWLAAYLAHSTLMLGAAWVVTRRIPSRFDRVVELVWRLALGVPVVTALAQQFTFLPGRTVVGSVQLQFAPDALSVSAIPRVVWLAASVVWMAGAMLGLAQLAFLQRSLHAALKRRTTMPIRGITSHEPLCEYDSIRISVVDDLSVPLALTNEICLPVWVVEKMDEEELRAVIAHEAAHVRRRDAMWRPLIAAVARVFFFQPLNWVASARLRELSECICDEQAIEATNSSLPLASALERVAVRSARLPAHLSLVPAMESGRSFALRRVMRILSTSHSRPVGGSARALTAAVLVLGIAGFALAPRVSVPSTAFMRYTINAADDAGRFTLTVDKGKVVGATISGRALQTDQVIQRGRSVRIAAPSGIFSLQLTPSGGIRWASRKSGT